MTHVTPVKNMPMHGNDRSDFFHCFWIYTPTRQTFWGPLRKVTTLYVCVHVHHTYRAPISMYWGSKPHIYPTTYLPIIVCTKFIHWCVAKVFLFAVCENFLSTFKDIWIEKRTSADVSGNGIFDVPQKKKVLQIEFLPYFYKLKFIFISFNKSAATEQRKLQT